MSDAFKCDRCGRYRDGEPHERKTTSTTVAPLVDLCEACEKTVQQVIRGKLRIGDGLEPCQQSET